MGKALNELLPFWQRGQTSSLSFPQKAFIFFRSTRIAAVSASALSLRRSSRSSSAMRFLSAAMRLQHSSIVYCWEGITGRNRFYRHRRVISCLGSLNASKNGKGSVSVQSWGL